MKSENPTYSVWLSFIAVSISAAALLLSAWQAYLFRSHNIISVQPVLDIEKQSEIVRLENMLWLALRNDGLGPAIIDKQTCIFNGKELDREEMQKIIGGLISHWGFELELPNKGAVLKPGEAQRFLMFDKDNVGFAAIQKERIKEYHKFFSTEIRVQFHSLYNENYVYSVSIGELFPVLAKRLKWHSVGNN